MTEEWFRILTRILRNALCLPDCVTCVSVTDRRMSSYLLSYPRAPGETALPRIFELAFR